MVLMDPSQGRSHLILGCSDELPALPQLQPISKSVAAGGSRALSPALAQVLMIRASPSGHHLLLGAVSGGVSAPGRAALLSEV